MDASATIMAKKNEEAKAPRMSQIERLQQQLAEAQAKAEARGQKKIEVLKQQFEAAIIRRNNAEAKADTIQQELFDRGVPLAEVAAISSVMDHIAYTEAE